MGDMWRICELNAEFKVSPTYPRLFAVPAGASDDMVRAVCEYRSMGRLPILAWRSHATGAVIVRSSQPQSGIFGKRCEADDDFLAMIARSSVDGTTLRVIDARPRKNAMGNRVKGGGYEGHLVKDGTLSFAGIERIQVMRRSVEQYAAAFETGRADPALVEKSGWLEHVRLVLDASAQAARLSHCQGQSVLVHCSDGWDRTAQIASLAQVIADPFFRTFTGFAMLLEKEWIAGGHKFAQRVGHCSADFLDDQRSPVFIQFLDCMWQILHREGAKFEFGTPFLIAIADTLYSCQYGTFLYENSRQRTENGVFDRTVSIWTDLIPRKKMFANPMYEPDIQPLAIVDLQPEHDLPLECWSEFYAR